MHKKKINRFLRTQYLWAPAFLIAVSFVVLSTDVSSQWRIWVTDLGDALDSWHLANDAAARPVNLSDALKKGDIFSRAIASSDAAVSSVAVTTLDTVHNIINQQCDGQLPRQDVSVVLWETPQGIAYRRMLERREITGPIRQDGYAQSCIRVMQCMQWGKVDVQPNLMLYSSQVSIECRQVVQSLWFSVGVRIESLATLPHLNVGDDVLVNAQLEDGPFDLLHDIEMINQIMFTNPNSAAPVDMYNIKNPNQYSVSLPLQRIPLPDGLFEKAAEDPDAYRRPSFGDRHLPDRDVNEENFRQSQREGDVTRLPNQGVDPVGIMLDSPAQHQLSDESGNTPSGVMSPALFGETIANNLCFEPPPPLPEPDYLDRSERLQEQVIEHNSLLDLESHILSSVSNALQTRGDDDVLPDPNLDEIIDDIIDEIDPRSAPELVDSFTEQFKRCMGDHTDLDPENYQREVWRNLTQPTALSQCIRNTMCREFSYDDAPWASLVMVICKVPPRLFGIIDDQPALSIEDIITEQLNVCTDARRSGQLMKRIQPKDAWTLMVSETVLGDMLAFRVLVNNGLTRRHSDPVQQSEYHRERNRIYEQLLLDMHDDPYLSSERNKYLIVGQPYAASFEPSMEVANRKQNTFLEAQQRLKPTNMAELRQHTNITRILDEYRQYVEQQMEFWDIANGHLFEIAKMVEAKLQTW